MIYQVHYVYEAPSSAGPFRGKCKTDHRLEKGERFYAAFGAAIVRSCREVKPVEMKAVAHRLGVSTVATSSDEERAEHASLSDLWATGRATRKQIMRCMELDRRTSR